MLEFVGPAARGLYVSADGRPAPRRATRAPPRALRARLRQLRSRRAVRPARRAGRRRRAARDRPLGRDTGVGARGDPERAGEERHARRLPLQPRRHHAGPVPIFRVTGTTPAGRAGLRHRSREPSSTTSSRCRRGSAASGGGVPRRADPFLRSSFIVSTSTFSGAWPLVPGPFEERGQLLEARLRQERRAARAPISPSPGIAWRSRFEPSGGHASRSRGGTSAAACRRSSRTRSTTSATLSAVVMSKPLANMWQESRHTPMRLSPPARSISSRSSSNDAPDRVAGAGGVLEQQPAAVGLRERVPHHLAHARERLVVRLADGRAGVQHHAVGPDLVAHPQRVDQRVRGLLPHARGPWSPG